MSLYYDANVQLLFFEALNEQGAGESALIYPCEEQHHDHRPLAAGRSGGADMNVMNCQMIPAWVDGKLTPVEKLRVHREGIRHRAVSVFVMHGDKVLIQRRAMSKYHTPGLWANTCCTHPLWNEAPEVCAMRRLNEELGIEGLYLTYRDQIEYRADVGGGMTEHEVVDIFLAETDEALQVRPNPDEVMETRWISIYDLTTDVARSPQNYSAWLKIYLSEHTDRIFGTLMRN